MSSLLHRLPRGIRDQIYREVLAPTGFAAISPIDPDNVATPLRAYVYTPHGPYGYREVELISFSMRQTCRAIYGESKDMFFKYNKIIVLNSWYFFNYFPLLRVQHVIQLFDMLIIADHYEEILRTCDHAHMMYDYGGKVETMTLDPSRVLQYFFELLRKPLCPARFNIVEATNRFVGEVREICDWNRRDEVGASCAWNRRPLNVQKTILMNIDLALFANTEPVDTEIIYSRLEKSMEDMSRILDADLFGNGRLCYTKGTLIAKVFQTETLQAVRQALAEKASRVETLTDNSSDESQAG